MPENTAQQAEARAPTDLSIVIVCYKGWERLIKCLSSLNSFTGKNISTEVIVVDNRSDDERIFSIERQFPNFKFIHNPINGGFSNGCNLGSKNAEGEFILFLNPDTVASEASIEELVNTARSSPGFAITSCRQVNEVGKECVTSGSFPSFFNLTGWLRAIFGISRSRIGAKDNPHSGISFPDWISGSVVLIRREMIKELGGFDEDFWMYFEDVDLCRRVRDIQGKVALCRNVTIEHNHGGSSRINLRTASLAKTEVHISRHVYISKHKTGLENILMQAFLVSNNLITGAIMAILGLLCFFVPKVFSNTLIYFGLIKYYAGAVIRLSWISPRSVNFRERS